MTEEKNWKQKLKVCRKSDRKRKISLKRNSESSSQEMKKHGGLNEES